MNIWDMRRAYVNIRRLRQILTVFAKHGFSHFLKRMRIAEYLPWVGRLIEKSEGTGLVDPGMDLPRRLAAAFEELGPVYVKLAQILASRPDLVAGEFQAAFSRMHDQVPPIPGDEIVPEIERSLNRPLSEAFASFTREALAAGSIGQVHGAELPDSRRVMVKVKRPGIEKIIEDDMNLIEALAELIDRHIPELAVLRPRMLAAELRRTLANELDFVGEAANATKFRRSLRENAGIVIPEIHWDLVARDILVMDRVEGVAVSEADFLPQSERSRIAREIADCFMQQYFETGLFHADPHAGNILYQANGRIALIDFGQTGRLAGDLKRTMGRMLMALKDGDSDLIADLYSEVGEFAPDADIQGFRSDLAGFIDRNYGIPADRVDFSAMAQEALSVARRNGLYLPRDFVLLVKSLMLTAGVVRDLDPGFRLDIAVTPAVRRLGLRMYRPETILKGGMRLASRFAGVMRRMPDDFRDLVEKARAGRFTIVFRHDNLQGVAERIGRATDRLTLGIVMAAIIIGSSIVISAGQAGALQGYVIPLFGGLSVPVALASLGFLLALLLSVYVAWGIFRDKN